MIVVMCYVCEKKTSAKNTLEKYTFLSKHFKYPSPPGYRHQVGVPRQVVCVLHHKQPPPGCRQDVRQGQLQPGCQENCEQSI